MNLQDQEPAARVKAQQDRTRVVIHDMENHELKFFEQRGAGALKDVTSDHLDEKRQDLRTLEAILQAWKAACD